MGDLLDLVRLIISGFCFGAIGIFVKVIGNDISSIFLSSIRLLVTPVLIFSYLLLTGKTEEIYFSRKDPFMKFIIGGVLGFGPTLGFYISSLKIISVSEAVFLHSVAFPLSAIFYKNIKDRGSVRTPEWLSLGMALVGIVLIYGLNPVISGGKMLGYTYAFISGIFYAVTSVSLKMLGEKRTLMGTIFWPLFIGGVFLLPFSFLEGPVFEPGFPTIMSLGGLILISTFLGFLMMAWGMKKVDVHVGSITLILSEPAAAVLLAWSFLGEVPGISVIFGGLFVIGAGIVLKLSAVDFLRYLKKAD